MRGLHQGRPDLLVTTSAKLLLARLREQLRISAVNLMAVYASKLRLIVLAAMPEGNISPGVASQANSILGSGG